MTHAERIEQAFAAGLAEGTARGEAVCKAENITSHVRWHMHGFQCAYALLRTLEALDCVLPTADTRFSEEKDPHLLACSRMVRGWTDSMFGPLYMSLDAPANTALATPAQMLTALKLRAGYFLNQPRYNEPYLFRHWEEELRKIAFEATNLDANEEKLQEEARALFKSEWKAKGLGRVRSRAYNELWAQKKALALKHVLIIRANKLNLSLSAFDGRLATFEHAAKDHLGMGVPVGELAGWLLAWEPGCELGLQLLSLAKRICSRVEELRMATEVIRVVAEESAAKYPWPKGDEE